MYMMSNEKSIEHAGSQTAVEEVRPLRELQASLPPIIAQMHELRATLSAHEGTVIDEFTREMRDFGDQLKQQFQDRIRMVSAEAASDLDRVRQAGRQSTEDAIAAAVGEQLRAAQKQYASEQEQTKQVRRCHDFFLSVVRSPVTATSSPGRGEPCSEATESGSRRNPGNDAGMQ